MNGKMQEPEGDSSGSLGGNRHKLQLRYWRPTQFSMLNFYGRSSYATNTDQRCQTGNNDCAKNNCDDAYEQGRLYDAGFRKGLGKINVYLLANVECQILLRVSQNTPCFFLYARLYGPSGRIVIFHFR